MIVKDILNFRNEETIAYEMFRSWVSELFDHRVDLDILDVSGVAELNIYPDGTDVGFYRKITPERLEKIWRMGADRLYVVTDVIRKYYRTGPVEGEVVG